MCGSVPVDQTNLLALRDQVNVKEAEAWVSPITWHTSALLEVLTVGFLKLKMVKVG